MYSMAWMTTYQKSVLLSTHFYKFLLFFLYSPQINSRLLYCHSTPVLWITHCTIYSCYILWLDSFALKIANPSFHCYVSEADLEKGPVRQLLVRPFSGVQFPFWLTKHKFQWFQKENWEKSWSQTFFSCCWFFFWWKAWEQYFRRGGLLVAADTADS